MTRSKIHERLRETKYNKLLRQMDYFGGEDMCKFRYMILSKSGDIFLNFKIRCNVLEHKNII